MPKRCTAEEIEDIVKDYNNGISVADIAKNTTEHYLRLFKN